MSSAGKSVVLVHGGFVDGAGWKGVYDILKNDGYDVAIVQNPTLSLAGDNAATRQILDEQTEPVVLVGHSYGGAVISEAGTHEKVNALVYVTAFVPCSWTRNGSTSHSPEMCRLTRRRSWRTRRCRGARTRSAAQEAGIAAISSRMNLLVTAAAAVAGAGDPLASLRAALKADDVDTWSFDNARVRLLHGQELHRRGRIAEARAELFVARQTFSDLDASPWFARASDELRSTGLRELGRPSGTTADLLTPQQARIASLAARGLTNKEIGRELHLSPRTVSTHLYQIFPSSTSRAGPASETPSQHPPAPVETTAGENLGTEVTRARPLPAGCRAVSSPAHRPPTATMSSVMGPLSCLAGGAGMSRRGTCAARPGGTPAGPAAARAPGTRCVRRNRRPRGCGPA
jgi:pimeloyl-ACP methyl ester carboxylesterase